MEYGLTRRTLDCRHFVPLTGDSFAAAKEAKFRVIRMLAVEEKLDMVLANYIEFEHAILQITLEKAISHLDGWSEGRAIVLSINRRLANLLTTCRLYLDHLPHETEPLLANSRDLLKRLTAEQYDARLGYRAMEALRNYAQHRGLPLHTLTLGGRWVDAEGGRRREHTTPLYVQIDSLRADGKFKESVLKELAVQGDKVPLKPLVRDYVTGIMTVHIGLRKAVQDLITESEQRLESMMTLYRQTEDNILGLAVVARLDHTVEEHTDIFPDFMQRRRELSLKNSGGGDLAKLVISSE